MASPLPYRPSIDYTPRPTQVIDLGDEDAEAALRTLGSETARAVLGLLDGGPATASDLAKDSDLSLQTVHYHLENLHEAGLVSDVGTWYSAKGAEMCVYAPTSERVEICLAPASDDPAITDHAGASSGPPAVIEND